MRLVWTGAPPEEPEPGPTGYNYEYTRNLGVQLDDGTIIETGIALESYARSDYTSCYGSHDHAELVRTGDGWMIRVVNQAGEVTGPLDVSVEATYASSDGRAWRKLDVAEAAASTGERVARLG